MSKEPISPEGERAAQKVRTAFFLVAALNVVIVVIVLFSRPAGESAPPQPPQDASGAVEATPDPAIQALVAVHDRLLHGYKTRDAERFCEVFSSRAVPPANEEYFRTNVIGGFHEKFGDILSSKITAESSVAPDGGSLVFDAVTSKRPEATIRCRLVREADGMKVLEWRLEERQL